MVINIKIINTFAKIKIKAVVLSLAALPLGSVW